MPGNRTANDALGAGGLHPAARVSSTDKHRIWPLRMIYCYGPAGEVAHWRQELAGRLPRAGQALHHCRLERSLNVRPCRSTAKWASTPIGVILNGVTGRMGLNQHLRRSLWAIIQQGGVRVNESETILPRCFWSAGTTPSWRQFRREFGGLPFTTNLQEALADPNFSIYFDAQTTDRRAEAVRAAIAAGKHVYCEKPLATALATALELYQLASAARIKHGVVQDKLWLPGLLKLQTLRMIGYFGRILSVRGEFGYWVFEGDTIPAQRPAWNYRKEEGGGIILDMLCHWRYVLDNVIAPVKAVSCLGATHIPHRWDETGDRYEASADDSAYATFQLEGGAIAQFNSSWCVRVRRDDLLTIQVDGSKGLRGGRTSGLLDTTLCCHASAGMESGCSQCLELLRRVAADTGAAELSRMPSNGNGNCSFCMSLQERHSHGPARGSERCPIGRGWFGVVAAPCLG